ncbi:PolC-type DNA polymerase III [Endomicrobium proavitum]|uniref:DNA polymerase III epsilon subunit n=1 Tax=Endomicrobium proavitum TaxID=1408281 RepID=A0A0G3WJ86_9BACT|nr:3'-5' exonuclease [Endomicrobium proavitum]AKL98393.1 DNA polymerase III epsilon subunit [Endomicrobium proavitum]
MNTEKIKTLYTNSPDDLVFLDIETTGLDHARGAKIVEIAMLKVKNASEEKFETLINPGCAISLESSKIHTIYDDMVKDAPLFSAVAKDVAAFIGSSIVVCHNAQFDLSFVNKELIESGVPAQKMYFIDTLKLARQYFSFDSNVLGNIAAAIGVEVDIKHRAMADVLTMHSVAKYIFKNMYRKGIDLIEPSVFECK